MRLRFEEYRSLGPASVDPDRGRLTRSRVTPDVLTIALPANYASQAELAKLIALAALSPPDSPIGRPPTSETVFLKTDGTLRTMDGGEVPVPEELDDTTQNLVRKQGEVLNEVLEAFRTPGRLPREYDVRFPDWKLTRRGIRQ